MYYYFSFSLQKISKEDSNNGMVLETIRCHQDEEKSNSSVDAQVVWKNPHYKESTMERFKTQIYSDQFIISLDEYSLIAFPTIFAVFNAIYWFSVFKNM